MSFDTDWDIEDYRTKFESEEHWRLKRDFLLQHKDKYPEERLICLAQVFVNMELMRCKYPDAVEKEVQELAKDVSSEYRRSRKNLLQRTFVKGSDAAKAKICKGAMKNPVLKQLEKDLKQPSNFIPFNQASGKRKFDEDSSASDNKISFVKSSSGLSSGKRFQ